MKKEEVIVIRDRLRENLEEKNLKAKVGKIVYYQDFEIVRSDENYNGLTEQDVFIVTRKVEQDGLELTYYEIYDEKLELISRTDENGEMQFSDKYLEKLNNKSAYSLLGLDKRKMYLNKENEFIVNDKPEKELNEHEKKENKEKTDEYEERKVDNPEPALIEEDLGIDRNSISYCQEIKDNRFFDMVSESNEFSRTAMLIYNEEEKEFMIIGLKNGKYEQYKSIESAKSTTKTVKDMGRDGKNIHDDTITGLFNYKGSNEYDFCVDIESDGKVQFQQVRRNLVTGELMASNLETSTQYRASRDVEIMMDREKNKDIIDETRKLNEIGDGANINQIKDDSEEKEEEEEEYQKVPWDRDPRR